MTTEAGTTTPPAGTAPAPAQPAPASPPAAAPAPAPAPATPPAPEQEPGWIKERLERAKGAAEKALLDQLGVTDPAAAKAAIEAARAAEEANKTAEQRAADAAAKLTQTEADRNRLNTVATEHAGRMMGVLTEEQQNAVKAIAGDDPAAQLNAIGVLGPTWAKQADAAAAAAAEATRVAAAAAGTAPAAPQPGGGAPGSPPDTTATYTAMKAKNPFAAAAYGAQHSEVYDDPK